MEIKKAGDTVTFDDVLEVCSTYLSKEENIALIKKAYKYVEEKHATQFRKSGEPYIIHPLWVAYILATYNAGPMTIAAGLLHDVLEDCGISAQEMSSIFGEEITRLVEAVTKITSFEPEKDDKDKNKDENHRKIYMATAKDVRVIVIKLADRLHNMRTLQFMREEKQKAISRETLEVYAPMAHRLGMNQIYVELEDLAFYYVDRDAYEDISARLAQKDEERKDTVNKMMSEVSKLLDKSNIKYRILGRAKHIYSIYKKCERKNKNYEDLYDLNALRIIIDSEQYRCYEVLGILHDAYHPVPKRFKDYIAIPKPNLYRSLHTVVVGEGGQIFEIQIRTEEMDEVAEKGVAAHWAYKESKAYSSSAEQAEMIDKLSWLRDFVGISSDKEQDENATRYMEAIQKDIFEANVYVFTPGGKVIQLPPDSTTVDFAYRIHTEVGHHMVGAKINDQMVRIETKLNSGDVCEIITNKNSPGPSEDWLKIVRTASARNKIHSFFARKESEGRKPFIDQGFKTLKDEIKKRNLDEKEYLSSDKYSTIYGEFGVKNFDDMLYAIAKKAITAYAVVDRVQPKYDSLTSKISNLFKKNTAQAPQGKVSNNAVIVKGVGSSTKIVISNCCEPIPGDDIVGYVSKGQGIKIHRKDCKNVKTYLDSVDLRGRILYDVYWDYTSINAKQKYSISLEILAAERPNLILDIMSVFAQFKINTISHSGEVVNDSQAHLKYVIQVSNTDQLNNMLKALNRIQGIYDVQRIYHKK